MIALSHDSEFRNPVTITSLEKFKFGSWKNLLNNQDLMFQSEIASKSSSGSYRYLTHTTDKAMMERKTKIRSTRIACRRISETDGSAKFITGEDLELWYRDKIKGTVRPEKLEFDEGYKKHFTKFVQGRFLMS